MLRVRGKAVVDCHVARDHGRLVLDGRVVDDAGAPIKATLHLEILTAETQQAVPLADAAGCGSALHEGIDHVGASSLLVHGDEAGRFCLTLGLPVDRYVARLTVDGTELIDPAVSDVPVDLSKRSLRLRFDPEPRILALDGAAFTLDAVATRDEEVEGLPPWVSGLPLVVTTELGAIVGRGTTGAGGHATMALTPMTLGAPGPGELRVRFDGDADTMASEHRATIRRDARVTLSLAEPLSAGIPEDGITLPIAVHTAFGAPRSGSLDARIGDVAVGAATVDGERTKLVVSFASEETSGAFVRVRYVPDVPYYVAGEALSVAVPIRGPSPLRQVPLILGAGAIAAWLLLGRIARRRIDVTKTQVMTRPPVHDGTEGVAVKKAGDARGPWTGRVVDAHDGTGVARARLTIEVPRFDGKESLASTFADDDGTFYLESGGAPPPNAELLVEGPLHAALRKPLPSGGELEIAIILRKRKILERLVRWARQKGPPFDQRPEPTPAQVRRAAAGGEVAAWADAVERAAFDAGDVDARAEAEVDALAPGPEEKPGHRAR